jgi:hypothetical protein
MGKEMSRWAGESDTISQQESIQGEREREMDFIYGPLDR